MFVYGDGDKNKHAETCCCRWRFVACSLAALLPASASSTSSCISSASAAETSAKQNAPENPLCLSQRRKGAVGACGVIAVHHLQQHLSANLFALVSIGAAAAAAAAALFAFHSASVWTVCNRFPLVLLSMCATRGGASACDILYAIHIPPPLTHKCRLRRCCCCCLLPSPTWQCIHIDVRRPYAYPPLRQRQAESVVRLLTPTLPAQAE